MSGWYGGIGSEDYWRAKHRPVAVVEPEPYPAPAVTSRDPLPAGLKVPGVVLDLVQRAERAGWAARWQYSRGCQPHATTGRPTAERDWYGVQCRHPESGARVVAVYGGAAWDSVFLITRTQLTTQGTITDAKAFLDVAGRVLDLRSWVAGRHVDKPSTRKTPGKVKASTRREGLS